MYVRKEEPRELVPLPRPPKARQNLVLVAEHHFVGHSTTETGGSNIFNT